MIAHPWGRNAFVGPKRFGELADIGLVGIEVDHQEHDCQMRQDLRQIAIDLGLVVTGSSDYHGARKTNHDLGCNVTAPAEYDRLKSRTGQGLGVRGHLEMNDVVARSPRW